MLQLEEETRKLCKWVAEKEAPYKPPAPRKKKEGSEEKDKKEESVKGVEIEDRDEEKETQNINVVDKKKLGRDHRISFDKYSVVADQASTWTAMKTHCSLNLRS